MRQRAIDTSTARRRLVCVVGNLRLLHPDFRRTARFPTDSMKSGTPFSDKMAISGGGAYVSRKTSHCPNSVVYKLLSISDFFSEFFLDIKRSRETAVIKKSKRNAIGKEEKNKKAKGRKEKKEYLLTFPRTMESIKRRFTPETLNIMWPPKCNTEERGAIARHRKNKLLSTIPGIGGCEDSHFNSSS